MTATAPSSSDVPPAVAAVCDAAKLYKDACPSIIRLGESAIRCARPLGHTGRHMEYFRTERSSDGHLTCPAGYLGARACEITWHGDDAETAVAGAEKP